MDKKYLEIVAHLEACYAKHGDTPQGVDWPNAQDADTRHKVLLGIIQEPLFEKVSVLDFGCGLCHFHDYLRRQNIVSVDYYGLDISDKYIAASRAKNPDTTLYQMDILDDAAEATLPIFDYVIMNGVFTEKVTLSFDEMWGYFREVVKRAFRHARIGLSFNVMSKQVDWERDDLFHLPFDLLACFLTNEVSRNFTFRHDYGLYEYAAFVYREPTIRRPKPKASAK